MPDKIKISLEKSKLINNEWNNENKLVFLINGCINFKKIIKDISKIDKEMKDNSSIN